MNKTIQDTLSLYEQAVELLKLNNDLEYWTIQFEHNRLRNSRHEYKWKVYIIKNGLSGWSNECIDPLTAAKSILG